MSKSDQQAVKQQAQGQMAQNNANETSTNTQLQGVLGTAQSNAASLLPGVVSGYSDIQSGGGYDPSILGNINSTYGDLASTGGISPGQETAIKNEASQAARSTYQTASDQAQRQMAATGGYGVSGSITGSLARQGSEAASTAANAATAQLAPIEQQGKIAGAAGLSNTQQNLASNKLAATQGLTNVYGMNETQVNATVGQILQNYQQTGQLNNQDMSILTNLAEQPGVFDKIVSTIGTLGGAATGVMSALVPKKIQMT